MAIHERVTATPLLTVQRIAAQKPAAREPVTFAHTDINSGTVAANTRKLQQWKGSACNPKMEENDMKNRRSLKVRMVPCANGVKSAHQRSCQLCTLSRSPS